jgi:hypothetical protein
MGGQNATVEEVFSDLEKIQARKKVKDQRMWPRLHTSSPEPQAVIDYASALLRVPIPNNIGSITTHAIKMLREQFLNWSWKVIEDFDPNNPHINLMNDKAPLPSALSDEGPRHVAPEPFPTSGHELILDAINGLNDKLPEGLRLVKPVPPIPVPTIFDFAWAFAMVDIGSRISRKGWPEGSFVVKMPELQLPPYNTQGTERKVNDRTAKWIGVEKPLNCQPYFAYYNPNGNVWQPGWTPWQADMFATDWFIID